MFETCPGSMRGIRNGLMATGFGLLVVGLICLVVPYWLTVPLQWLIGSALLFSGVTGFGHLIAGLIAFLLRLRPKGSASPIHLDVQVLRNSSVSAVKRSPFWMVVLMQLSIGAMILLAPGWIRPYWLLALVLGVAAEGCLILWVSLHFDSLGTKCGMWFNGLLSLVTVAVAILHWQQPGAAYWIGALIGAKFLMLGWILLDIGLRASDTDLRFAYIGEGKFQDTPHIGSIYAVYYGPAFHCGISVGDGQIVDYLSDGVVRLISWEEFLLGRRALEWNYPDVPAGEASAICTFARQLVGKYNKYDAFRFNCENLAIYCRSVGVTSHSAFSQAAVGVELVKRKPILGSMLQLLNRAASWFLYGAGGPFGKKVGFAMIRVARVLTDWVVARPMRQSNEFTRPTEVYMPSFVEQKLGS